MRIMSNQFVMSTEETFAAVLTTASFRGCCLPRFFNVCMFVCLFFLEGWG